MDNPETQLKDAQCQHRPSFNIDCYKIQAEDQGIVLSTTALDCETV